MKLGLQIGLIVTSVLLVLMILLHRGRGKLRQALETGLREA